MPGRVLSGFLALVCAIATLAACINLRTPPAEVVSPEIVGLWRSAEGITGGKVRITLANGIALTVDERDELSLGYPGPGDGAVVLYGPRPTPWYIVAPVTRPNEHRPAGCHPAQTVLVYDDGDAVVLRVRNLKGLWSGFAIRLPKAAAAEIRSPLPEWAGFYGDLASACLDDRGEVSVVTY